MLKNLEKNLLALKLAAKKGVRSFVSNVEGSDSTEKVGMVVVAVVVVGLVALAVQKFMPGLIENIFSTASQRLQGIFGIADPI